MVSVYWVHLQQGIYTCSLERRATVPLSPFSQGGSFKVTASDSCPSILMQNRRQFQGIMGPRGTTEDSRLRDPSQSCLKPLPASTLHREQQVCPRSEASIRPPLGWVCLSPFVLAEPPPPQGASRSQTQSELPGKGTARATEGSHGSPALVRGRAPRVTREFPPCSLCPQAPHAHPIQTPTGNLGACLPLTALAIPHPRSPITGLSHPERWEKSD